MTDQPGFTSFETDRSLVEQHLVELTRIPRPCHSKELETARQYVTLHFEDYGWDVRRHDFDVLNDVGELNLGENLHGTNLIATRRETFDASRPRLCLGAHLDSRPDTPGADDNASGVAVLLNLADRLNVKNSKAEIKDNNNYLFMAFSGEEMGLLGSNYFSKNPTIDAKSINYMINMDMVGRMKADSTLAVYGVGTSPMFKQTLKSNNDKFKLVQNESGVGPSDHTSFYLIDVPVLHFFTGQHEDYHKPSDDSEKLNYAGMHLISDYIFEIISDLNDNGKLAFRKTKNESEETPRFKVGLGVVPDYLFDGKGMRIDGTREDTPAYSAGLQKGDVVIKLGDSAVTDMMSYMRALSVFEKGNKAPIIVKRGTKMIETEVQF